MDEPPNTFTRPPIQREIEHPPVDRGFSAPHVDKTFERVRK